MKFGYVWRGSGAKDEKAQQRALSAYGCPAVKMVRETSPARDERDRILSILRPGDEFCAVSAAYIADDIVELHWILSAVEKAGASVYLVEFGENFVGSEPLARLTEDYAATKRKEQTKAARERLKKLPRHARGGRPRRNLDPADYDEFIAQWNNKFVSFNEMASRWRCHKDKLFEWAGELDLGDKAR